MLREARQARAAYEEHKARARQLYDLGQDLKIALDGVVAMSTRIEEKASGLGLDQSLSAMKHSAMSLFHVTDMLSSEGMGVLEQTRARVTWVSPLSIAAAAISIFSAESERRGIAIQLHGQGKAVSDIETEPEILRLAFFHAIGFALSRSPSSDIDLSITPDHKARQLHINVCCSTLSDGNNVGVEELNAVLQGQIDDIDTQAHSLMSLRLLLSRLQGVGSVSGTDERLMMTLYLPLNLTTSNQEASPSIQELPAA